MRVHSVFSNLPLAVSPAVMPEYEVDAEAAEELMGMPRVYHAPDTVLFVVVPRVAAADTEDEL